MTVLETFTTSLMDSSPAHWVQTLFILASCFILTITVAPAAERKLLLNYGARRSHDDTATGGRISFAKDETKDSPIQTVRKLTSFGQVPHSWFFTYYVFYIFCAEAWAVQYFLDGPNLLGFLANRQVTFAPDAPAMSGSQISIIWVMMFLQAGRRLCECFVVMKPSKSTMWFVHWVVGLGYYLGVSVAIWVEGSGTSTIVVREMLAKLRDSCHCAQSAAWSPIGRCPAQGSHLNTGVLVRLGHATPMPQASCRPEEVLAARFRHV